MPGKILVVAEAGASALIRAGFDVVHAPDGDAAIDAAARERPALVVIDVAAPGLRNAFEVCRLLKAAETPSRVLMTAPRGGEADRFWGLKQGADAVLATPFDEGELLEAVRQLL